MTTSSTPKLFLTTSSNINNNTLIHHSDSLLSPGVIHTGSSSLYWMNSSKPLTNFGYGHYRTRTFKDHLPFKLWTPYTVKKGETVHKLNVWNTGSETEPKRGTLGPSIPLKEGDMFMFTGPVEDYVVEATGSSQFWTIPVFGVDKEAAGHFVFYVLNQEDFDTRFEEAKPPTDSDISHEDI